MANVNVPICLRQSDGKLIAIDANCSNVQLPACVNATDGQLWVYHASCDGVGGSDGWFQVCRAAGGGLQITIPDNCCADQCCSGGDYVIGLDFGGGVQGSRTVSYDYSSGYWCFYAGSGQPCDPLTRLTVEIGRLDWGVYGFVVIGESMYAFHTLVLEADFDCSGHNASTVGYTRARVMTTCSNWVPNIMVDITVDPA